MRIAVPVSSAGPAIVALVAACLLQAGPAAARKICGDTPVEVTVQVRKWRHAGPVARIVWSDCARKTYGDEWSNLSIAKWRPDRPDCYDTRAWPRYYSSRPPATCTGTETRDARWVCFYRATPCRWRRSNGRRDWEHDDD
jgi:hypothetical protein